MSNSFSRILAPSFENDDDPFRHYDDRGEPLEDRLYLPCGIDPDKKKLAVAFVHPLPQNNLVLEQRRSNNVNFEDAAWLISTGTDLANRFSATPIYVFEATKDLWLPVRRYIHSSGEALTLLLSESSRGRVDADKALAIQQRAHTTFAVAYADEAYSVCLKGLAEAYQYIQKVTITALKAKCLSLLPFEHQLYTIPYFGDMVIATYLSELGDYRGFKQVDSVVAWFGLDPSVSVSAEKKTAQSRITKRGTKIGRRMMWITARNFANLNATGKAYYKKLRRKGFPYDGAICKIAAKLVRIAFCLLRDGSQYEETKAFQC